LTSLQTDTTYYYRLGDETGWSNVHTFSTDRQLPIRFVATADLGTHPYCEGCDATVAGIQTVHSKVASP